MPPPHSDLPIITLDPPPRRGDREKYGGAFYLAILGLVVLVALVGWFGYGVASRWGVWTNIYRLHDAHRAEAERIAAAYALSRDPRVTPKEALDISLRRPLPPLARYLLAESLTADVVGDDPRAYALMVARSEGWPDWLRLLLARPLAYAADQDRELPLDILQTLSSRSDPYLALWADYTRARLGVREAERSIERAAEGDGAVADLARILLQALQSDAPGRVRLLDWATHWSRRHHPEARQIWQGWEERDGRLVRRPAPELPHPPG